MKEWLELKTQQPQPSPNPSLKGRGIGVISGIRDHRAGFTLVEAVIAVLLVGMVFVAALQMLGGSAAGRRIVQDQRRGEMLAQELLSEIMQEAYEEPGAVGVPAVIPEQLLASYYGGSLDQNVSAAEMVAQHAPPTLPPNAVTWEVTRVRFMTRNLGATDGETSVQLRYADDSGMPGDAVLAAEVFQESATGSSYGWQEVNFNHGGLDPAKDICIVFVATKGSDIAMGLQGATNGGGGLSTSADFGATWTNQSPARLTFEVHGTYTTPGGTSSITIGPDGDDTATDRTTFDDVDDFHGWSRTPPENPNGATHPSVAGWTREAFVDWVQPSDLSVSASETGLKRITVRVTSPTGVETTHTALRGRAGVHDWTDTDEIFTSQLGIDVRASSKSGSVLFVGADMLNRPLMTGDVLINGGFEGAIGGWAGTGGATISPYGGSPHEGAQSATLASRSAPNNGVRQDITGRITSGQAYRVKAAMRRAPFQFDNFRIELIINSTGEGTQVFATSYLAITVFPGWAQIDEVLTPTWTDTLNSAYFKIRTENNSHDVGIDGASMVPQ